MKITGAFFPGRAVVQPKQPFHAVLQQRPPAHLQKLPPPLPKKASVPPGMTPATHVARSTQQVCTHHEKTAATLSTARATSLHSTAQLQEARLAHHHVTDERLDSRFIDLICKELVIEFSSEPSKSRVANQDLPFAAPIPALPTVAIAVDAPRPVDGAVKAAQAVELIERIETFIKDSRRPSIALTLNNSLGAKVEIERIGPREVALKIVGHKGPPPAEDISRIRDEMQAHGLKVCALSVA